MGKLTTPKTFLALLQNVCYHLVFDSQVEIAQCGFDCVGCETEHIGHINNTLVAVVEHSDRLGFLAANVLHEVKVALGKEPREASTDNILHHAAIVFPNEVCSYFASDNVKILSAARVVMRGAEAAGFKHKPDLGSRTTVVAVA